MVVRNRRDQLVDPFRRAIPVRSGNHWLFANAASVLDVVKAGIVHMFGMQYLVLIFSFGDDSPLSVGAM